MSLLTVVASCASNSRARTFSSKPCPTACLLPRDFHQVDADDFVFCHRLSIRLIFYLVDTIMGRSRPQVLQHHNFVMSLLKKLRFIINIEKSDLAPTERHFPGALMGHCGAHDGTTGRQASDHQGFSQCSTPMLGLPSVPGLHQLGSSGCPLSTFAAASSAVNKDPSCCFRACHISQVAQRELLWCHASQETPWFREHFNRD